MHKEEHSGDWFAHSMSKKETIDKPPHALPTTLLVMSRRTCGEHVGGHKWRSVAHGTQCCDCCCCCFERYKESQLLLLLMLMFSSHRIVAGNGPGYCGNVQQRCGWDRWEDIWCVVGEWSRTWAVKDQTMVVERWCVLEPWWHNTMAEVLDNVLWIIGHVLYILLEYFWRRGVVKWDKKIIMMSNGRMWEFVLGLRLREWSKNTVWCVLKRVYMGFDCRLHELNTGLYFGITGRVDEVWFFDAKWGSSKNTPPTTHVQIDTGFILMHIRPWQTPYDNLITTPAPCYYHFVLFLSTKTSLFCKSCCGHFSPLFQVVVIDLCSSTQPLCCSLYDTIWYFLSSWCHFDVKKLIFLPLAKIAICCNSWKSMESDHQAHTHMFT